MFTHQQIKAELSRESDKSTIIYKESYLSRDAVDFLRAEIFGSYVCRYSSGEFIVSFKEVNGSIRHFPFDCTSDGRWVAKNRAGQEMFEGESIAEMINNMKEYVAKNAVIKFLQGSDRGLFAKMFSKFNFASSTYSIVPSVSNDKYIITATSRIIPTQLLDAQPRSHRIEISKQELNDMAMLIALKVANLEMKKTPDKNIELSGLLAKESVEKIKTEYGKDVKFISINSIKGTSADVSVKMQIGKKSQLALTLLHYTTMAARVEVGEAQSVEKDSSYEGYRLFSYMHSTQQKLPQPKESEALKSTSNSQVLKITLPTKK